MMQMMRISLSLAACMLAVSPLAAQELSTNPGLMGSNIRSLERIRTGDLVVVEADGMKGLAGMTDNGRFVIVGRMLDTWTGQEIKSVAALKEAVGRIDLAKLNVPIAELAPLRMGTGAKRVQVFVDPKCPYCHRLLADMASLTRDYTFEVLIVPVLGKASDEAAYHIECAKDKTQALQQLMTGQIGGLEQSDPCDLAGARKRILTAQVVGVRGVPFTIAPDGRAVGGYVQNIAAWLEGVK